MYTPHIFSSRCTRSGLPPLLPCIPPAHPLTPFILAMDISVFLHYLPSSCGCYGTLFFIFYSHLSDMQPRTQCELTFSRNKHLLSVGENSSRALANTTAAKNRWRCIWASLTSTVGLQLPSSCSPTPPPVTELCSVFVYRSVQTCFTPARESVRAGGPSTPTLK